MVAIKSVLTSQTDFTGEFPVTERTSAMCWFNESVPDGNLRLLDSSGHRRHFTVSGWSATTASLLLVRFGRYFRQNINNPTSEKTHLVAANDGSFFSSPGEKIAVGGWINPTPLFGRGDTLPHRQHPTATPPADFLCVIVSGKVAHDAL